MSQNHRYPNVLKNVITVAEGAGNSLPVLVADFKTVDFTVIGGGILAYSTLVGVFQVGERVNSSSGGIGYVAFDNATNSMYIERITGTFLNTNTITGVTSGATAVLTANISAANFTIEAFISNQENPPNLSLPSTTNNQYSEVSYMDLSNGSSFDTSGALYNPTGVAETKTFEAQLDGARWFFVAIMVRTSGVLLRVDVSLFSNFT